MKSRIDRGCTASETTSKKAFGFLFALDKNGFNDKHEEHHKKFDNGNHYWIDF